MQLKHWIIGVLFIASMPAFGAESRPVTGVVSNVNVERQTITIRGTTTTNRARRTYFVTDETRLTSNGKTISLSDIKRGNAISLQYRATDRGREIVSFRLPDPDDIVDVIAIESTEERTISGRITGIRKAKRTLTVREDGTRERLTIKVPVDVSITRDGRPYPFRNMREGDTITGRYSVTERGLLLLTARAPRAAAQPAATAEMPKTAGHLFAYLFTALGLLSAAAFARLLRRRNA